jgi:putative phosphoribosyl transferase
VTTSRRFADRTAAGRELGAALAGRVPVDVVVLGIPRGGVPVAAAVADALHAPLDVIVVRKLGVPSHPELAAGAIGEDGTRVVNDDVVRATGTTAAALEAVEARELAELDRRVRTYRSAATRIPLDGRTVVVVDDGIATGATTRAAVDVTRAHGAARVILAVPVAPRDAVAELSAACDDVVALETPRDFRAVGQWYRDFDQTTDEQVLDLLRTSRRRESGADPEAER